MDAIPGFLTAGLLSVVVAIAVLRVVKMMIDLELSVAAGAGTIVILLGLTAVSIQQKTQGVAGVFLVCLVALMATYPFAREQLERIELRAFDIDALDRAHFNMAQRPDNVAAQFELARCLHRFGLHGHAIAIAEHAASRLSTSIDDVKNASVRDIFTKEILTCKQWKRDADPKSFRPVACPLCGAMNEPGTIACRGCAKPYLLELARKLDIRPRFMGRLVVSWALVALLVVAAAQIAVSLTGTLLYIAFVGVFAVIGVILALLFRDRKLVGGLRDGGIKTSRLFD